MDRKRLFRLIVYFRRGHGTWFAMWMSFLNFIVIQYRLLIENVWFLRNFFTSLSMFAAMFLAIYIPVATLVGWLDYKKMTKPREREADYYFTHPTFKERELTFPAWITVLKTLEKLMEKQGMDPAEIRSVRERLERFLRRA